MLNNKSDNKSMFDKEKFKETARDFLINISGNRRITFETKLFDDGIIDSLNFIQLILFIEKRFGIELKPFSIQIEDFESLNTLSEAMVRTYLEARDGK